MTLAELAALADCEIIGSPESQVAGVADPQTAGPEHLVFVVEPRYMKLAQGSRAGFFLANEPIAGKAGLVSRKPREAMAIIMQAFAPPPITPGVHVGAFVDPTALLAADVYLGPGAVVGAGATVGQGTVLHAHVVIYPQARVGRECVLHAGVVVREKCILGDRVVVQPGAVIGSDGFGFVPISEGILKIPHLGIVKVQDDVEIGANCAIDRATLGTTVIGKGTKIDNMVHLAHNVRLGQECMLAAQVGVAGSVEIGDRCTFGGQSGVVGHLRVGDDVTVAAKSGLTRNVPAGQIISGFPGRPHREELRRAATFRGLPERVARLESQLSGEQGQR